MDKSKDKQHMDHEQMSHKNMDHESMNHENMGHMMHDAGQPANEHSMEGHDHDGGMSGHTHHAMMVRDFRRRFFFSLVLAIPILFLSPVIQGFFGLDLSFPGDSYILLVRTGK